MEVAEECGNLQIPTYNDDRQNKSIAVASVENVLPIFVVISESDYLYMS